MGFLITVEGGEYTGKSSLAVPGLGSVLRRSSFPVLESREPGGTPRCEEIRQEIFRKLSEGASTRELAKLFNVARQIHLEEVVLPFMGTTPNGIVILDRYSDSTFVYQGLEPEDAVDISTLLELHNAHTQGIFPDLTLLLHIPESRYEDTYRNRQAASRDAAVNDETAWDTVSVDKHIQRQRLYMELPDLFDSRGIPRDFRHVDASVQASDVVGALTEHVEAFLRDRGVNAELRKSFDELKGEGLWAELDGKWVPPREGRDEREGSLPLPARR